jgi:hypothetical protein
MMQENIKKASNTETLMKRIYFISIGSLYILYIITFLGLFYVNTAYIHWLSVIVHLGICVFLLWRFHPFKEHVLRPFDSTIIFACASFLFVNIIATDIGVSYIQEKLGFFGYGLPKSMADLLSKSNGYNNQ